MERYIIEFKDGKEVSRVSYELSDEQIADEVESQDILEKAEALIDEDPKAFLKRLTARLIKKGLLP